MDIIQVTRPKRIHEYKLTAYSLYAAVSVGMTTDIILDVLERFSKVNVPAKVIKFIRDCTLSYGKVKLVLKFNKYHIESSYPEMLRVLLQDPIVKAARVVKDGLDIKLENKQDDFGALITIDREDDIEEEIAVYDQEKKVIEERDFSTSFEIDTNMVEEVKKRCIELDFPLMEEYDFRHDELTPNLSIDLSAKTIIRDYQEKSLSKMFGGGSSGGRARSGIIVLPTGAGTYIS
jgi:DNA excision repair protein ERCC-3